MRRALLLSALLLGACRPEPPPPVPLPADARDPGATAGSGIDTLAAAIPARGASLHGTVVLMAEGGRLIAAGALDGAVPAAEYTVAVHERGDCAAPGPVFALPGAAELSAADATGAPDMRHAIGDFGGFAADAAGQARFSNTRRSPVGAAVFAGRSAIVRSAGGDIAGCGTLQPIAR